MNKKYNALSVKQTDKFLEIFEEKQELIYMGMRKINIPAKLYSEFFTYGLEGLLDSFLIFEDGGVSAEDFNYFALATIKRKIIDELRRRSKEKSIPLDTLENTTLVSTRNNEELLRVELMEYLKQVATPQELKFTKEFIRTGNFKKTIKNLNISTSTGRNLHREIKKYYLAFIRKN